jgi:nitrite reductase (NO-forming)
MRAIKIVSSGLEGRIIVNGEEYNSQMPSLNLSNEDVANALTYVFGQWGNAGHDVTATEVAAVRAKH